MPADVVHYGRVACVGREWAVRNGASGMPARVYDHHSRNSWAWLSRHKRVFEVVRGQDMYSSSS